MTVVAVLFQRATGVFYVFIFFFFYLKHSPPLEFPLYYRETRENGLEILLCRKVTVLWVFDHQFSVDEIETQLSQVYIIIIRTEVAFIIRLFEPFLLNL